MADLFVELKRRNLFRVAIVYVVVAWIILQLSEILMPAFGIPEWGLRFIFIVIMFGFPFVVESQSSAEITTEEVAEGRYVLFGRGGNILASIGWCPGSTGSSKPRVPFLSRRTEGVGHSECRSK